MGGCPLMPTLSFVLAITTSSIRALVPGGTGTDTDTWAYNINEDTSYILADRRPANALPRALGGAQHTLCACLLEL